MLSIIIPTYNERDNIQPLVSRLEKSLQEDHEIIFVDDNSPDGTAEKINELSKRFPAIRLVKRERKSGLTGAVVAGAAVARGDRIVVMDADLSHPPELVPELAAGLRDHDLVIGSRMLKGGGVQNWQLHRKMISKGADMLARVLIGVGVSDPLTGFFAVRRHIFEKTRFRTKGYKILLNIMADNTGIKTKEVPYAFGNRYAGKTKLGIVEVANYVPDLARILLGRAWKH
jgi:dolichol-phosphate mannosyltransferase